MKPKKQTKIRKRIAQLKYATDGYTLEDICEIINGKFKDGMLFQNLHKYCNGQDMYVSTLLKLCFALQCTPNDLIDYEHLLKTDENTNTE